MDMKKILYGIITLTMTGLFSACLDENPKYSQNDQIIFSSDTNAELALLGCYGRMCQNGSYGQMWQEVVVTGSGLAWTQRNGNELDELSSLNILPSNPEVSSAWDGMYKVIAEVNAFLTNLEASDLSEATKIQMGGEAHFLRAIAYYNLASHFGDVPLKLIASTSEGIASPRSPKEEVFKVVLEDLAAAEAIAASSEAGRLNSWAAKAFRGKVFFKMAMLDIDREANLNNAKKDFDEVYAANVYALYNSFGKLFLPWNNADYVANNKEAIIQLNFNGDSETCFNRGTNRFAPQASTSGIAWGTVRVAKYAHDLHYGTYPGDPRIQTNFMSQWRTRSGNNQPNPSPQVGTELCPGDSTYTYPKSTFMATPEQKTTTTVIQLPYELFKDKTNPTQEELNTYTGVNETQIKGLWDKFTPANSNSNQWSFFGKLYDQTAVGTRSHMHLIVYRYAEMLLLMADVYNELGDQNRAVELANEVLRRARESASPAATEPADWSAALSKEEVTEKLYFERLFELMGEPSLYDMARIRGTSYLEKLLLKNNNHNITKASYAKGEAGTPQWQDRMFDKGQTDKLSEEFLRRNLLLPIPYSEINANSAISVSDNNYGYN